MYPLASCPTRGCNSSADAITAVAGTPIELFVDVSEMNPTYDQDMAALLSNPTSLTLTTRVSNASSSSSYLALNSSYTGLFSTSGTIVKFNRQSTPFEFTKETFHLEVTSGDCAFLTDSIILHSA